MSLAINSSGYIFAGTGGGVFLSTDNGTNWTQINNGLTNTTHSVLLQSIQAAMCLPELKEGVFLSTDNGTNWTEINNGLTVLMSILLQSIQAAMYLQELMEGSISLN